MGPSSDEIQTELTETREDLDRKLDDIERRAKFSLRKYAKYAPAAAGALGTAGTVVAAVLLVRSRRRRSLADHVGRAVPKPLWRLGSAAALMRRGIPSMRIYIGQQEPVRESQSSRLQSIALRAAESASAAAASAAFGYVTSRVKPLKSRAKGA
jgi:hypothetical protein